MHLHEDKSVILNEKLTAIIWETIEVEGYSRFFLIQY